ncbi:MAG TPA: sugar phosphate isomerase [Phycisphaerales bacterium]|nr:sugar phosphate isomerase [Phycisphaerales bacterium]
MSDARERAKEFLTRQKAFRLGTLLTESSHPKTRTLSQTIQADTRAGIEQLLWVDADIPPALARVFGQNGFGRLVEAFAKTFRVGGRVFFTGCGATGRLSILLEAAWQRFWREASGREEGLSRLAEGMMGRCHSIMAGGDFALIKAVEGFEDFPDFGRHQLLQAGVQRDDMVVAITEGGETPFVIGTAWQGLDSGARVFFVYNNPTEILREHVQRSREVIEEPRITKLDLTTGPMAVMGSTRMQAVTVELLVVGAAMEMAMARVLESHLSRAVLRQLGLANPSCGDYTERFTELLAQLSAPDAVAAIARATAFEEGLYTDHGLVTYAAELSLLDVLTDTTERSPTFMVPAFRKQGDTVAPVSWAFVKTPFYPTRQAWYEMLQREPRGLDWGPEEYEALNAPPGLRARPPKLDNREIHRFQIGHEPDPSRTDAPDSALVTVAVTQEAEGLHQAALERFTGFRRTAAITVGPTKPRLNTDEHFHVRCDLPASPLRLWEHLAIKLVLNTMSTATMTRMGRVIGNAMVWLSPSNKKLIDRGCRLLVQVTGCPYETACEVLYEAIDEVTARSDAGEEVPSPVALAIERLSDKDHA